jgi:maltose phosphorylase
MGPDKLNMMVSNNCYTNIMAKKTFDYTLSVLDDMKSDNLHKLDKVMEKTNMSQSEANQWREITSKIRIPYDERTGVYEQHEGFFNLPHIDVSAIPSNQFPVQNHWAYDRIFRYNMAEQPDVLQFLFLFSQDYSLKTKLTNYEYYEPLCCHESPLSHSIHSILAAEIGKHEKAYEYANTALSLDYDNRRDVARNGYSMSAMVGAWLNIVCGFGGFRSDGQKLVFNPSIPKNWESISFKIQVMGSLISVKINQDTITFCLVSGSEVEVTVFGKEYMIDSNNISINLDVNR